MNISLKQLKAWKELFLYTLKKIKNYFIANTWLIRFDKNINQNQSFSLMFEEQDLKYLSPASWAE